MILSTLLNQLFQNQPFISRFTKGVFRSRPPVPHYKSTWDVHIVLSHLGSFAVASELNLKDLTLTLIMLMARVSAQRTQSLYLLDLNFMKHGTDMIEFVFPTHIKQSRQGYKTPTLQLKAYPADPNCVWLRTVKSTSLEHTGFRDSAIR